LPLKPLGALGILLAYPASAGGDGDQIIARARATEAAEVQALARAPIELHTHGYINDGKASHRIESIRLIQYRPDGTILNQFQRGQLDGKPIDEEELRKAIGAQDRNKEHGEILTYALAPLSVSASASMPSSLQIHSMRSTTAVLHFPLDRDSEYRRASRTAC